MTGSAFGMSIRGSLTELDTLVCKSRNVIEEELTAKPEVEQPLWLNITEHQCPADVLIPEQCFDRVRARILELLVQNLEGKVDKSCSIQPVDTECCATVIRAYLLEAWATVVDDPATSVASWLYEGAPAGLARHSTMESSLRPSQKRANLKWRICLQTWATFRTTLALTRMKRPSKRWRATMRRGTWPGLTPFASFRITWVMNPCCQSLRASRSRSSILIRDNMRRRTGSFWTADGTASPQRRSGNTRACCHGPLMQCRLRWSRWTWLEMNNNCLQNLYIADIVDAFWLIPLRRDERRFFCAKLRDKYYMFNRAARGSRMAPLIFAAVMTLASRWVPFGDLAPVERVQRHGL